MYSKQIYFSTLVLLLLLDIVVSLPRNFTTAATTTAAQSAWSLTGHLTSERFAHAATVLNNGKLLVTGGLDYASLVFFCELYDLSTRNWTWTPDNYMKIPRAGHTSSLLPNGKVLVAGGSQDQLQYFGMAYAEVYDPIQDKWTLINPMHDSRIGHTASVLQNGKVLVAGGGAQFEESLHTCEIYDPSTETWSVTGNMYTARQYHTATVLKNGKVLVAGGADASTSLEISSTTELYDPITGKWTNSSSMNIVRIWHTATLLMNGEVLVTGGDTYPSSQGASAELYDPITDTWTMTNTMQQSRNLHTSTLLPNGKVLITGGRDETFGFATTELYDPVTGNWTYSGDMFAELQEHTASLLNNGDVLVTGGGSSYEFPSNISMIYNSSTEKFTLA